MPNKSFRGFDMGGWAIWITGLPASGKSTVADAVVRQLGRQHIRTQLLSIDMVRKVLTPNPSYSEGERTMVYGALVLLAHLLTQNNANVIIDATGNRRRYRGWARKRIRRFGEVYLKCPLQVCMKRERRRKERFGAPSRIYLKGERGVSKTVPGVGVAYEEPFSPEVTLDTSRLDSNECAERVVRFIHRKFGSRRSRRDER